MGTRFRYDNLGFVGSYCLSSCCLSQVYFTRNGKIIGKKDVVLPRGGFYPTVGMMSKQEKVKVELRPLSG